MDTSASNESLVQVKKKIKKERVNEEIQEYAETAMNELLGWYGYNSKDDLAKSSRQCRSRSRSHSSGPDSPKYPDGCGWCGKPAEESAGLSSGNAIFCSELCFSQSRRANFKKNKTCDWCRHVRHTVSYVDFQDGASQLQFCSDKCLNQYKMHIFCRETEAHLEIHPHLHGDDHSGMGLITPDLWLKNCRSPDSHTSSPASSPKPQELQPQTSPLPLITVAHPSKLLAQNNNDESKRVRNKILKKHRKRSLLGVQQSKPLPVPEQPQDLRVRHSPQKIFEPRNLQDDTSGNHVSSARNQFFATPDMFRPDPRLIPPQYFNQTSPPRKPFVDLPPVTVLVPYPVVVPLPLPIPIPLPLSSFLPKEEKQKMDLGGDKKASSQNTTEASDQDEVRTNGNVTKEDGECEEKNGIVRPLRKRKKIVDPKNRIITKKKPVSV